MYLKESIKGLIKRKTIVLLLIIQLTISFSLLLNSFSEISWNTVNFRELNNILKYDMNNIIEVKYIMPEENMEYINKVNTLSNYIDNLDSVKGYGNYNIYGNLFEELKSNKKYKNPNMSFGEIKKAYPLVEENAIKNIWMKSTDTILVEQASYDMINLKVIEGRSLNKNDFKITAKQSQEQPIPMLAGYNLKDFVPIGTVLTYENEYIKEPTKYQVVGIMGKNSKWLGESDIIENPPTNIDGKLVMPFVKDEKEVDMLTTLVSLSTASYILENKNDYKLIKDKINNKAEELELNIEQITLKAAYYDYQELLKQYIGMDGFISLIFIFAATLSIIAAMLSSIIYRKREFGIKIVAGFTLKDIEKIILGEISIITIVSFTISYLICLYNTNNVTMNSFLDEIGKYEFFRGYGLWYIPVIIILAILLSSILPIIQIRKLQPIELLKK